jgi:hypothetical protein
MFAASETYETGGFPRLMEIPSDETLERHELRRRIAEEVMIALAKEFVNDVCRGPEHISPLVDTAFAIADEFLQHLNE